MAEQAHNIRRGVIKTLLSQWEEEKEVIGAYIVTITDQDSLEVEVRMAGTIPGFSPTQFRGAVQQAKEETGSGWECRPEGLGFPILFEGTMLGLCIIFPWGDIVPTGRWEKDVAELALRLGPLSADKEEAPPSLEALAEAIPERQGERANESRRRLHWETSKARVQVPVKEELAQFLLLDHMPLF